MRERKKEKKQIHYINLQFFKSRHKSINLILTGEYLSEVSSLEFSVFNIIISLCHDNASFTISRNF